MAKLYIFSWQFVFFSLEGLNLQYSSNQIYNSFFFIIAVFRKTAKSSDLPCLLTVVLKKSQSKIASQLQISNL